MTAKTAEPRLVLNKGIWHILDEDADIHRSLHTRDREVAERYFGEYLALKAGFSDGAPGAPVRTGERGRPAHQPKLTQRNGVWYIVHRANNDFRRSCGTTDHAKAVAMLKEYVLSLGGYDAPEEPTVADLMDLYRERKLHEYRERAARKVRQQGRLLGQKPEEIEKEAFRASTEVMINSTMDIGLRNLKRHLGTIRIMAINNAVVRSYVALRRKDGKRHGNKVIDVPVDDPTIYRELTYLKSALNIARQEDADLWFGTGKAAPDFKMPVSSETESRMYVLTHDEVRSMLTNCTEPHIKLFILLAVHTGARAKAVYDLCWKHIDFQHQIIDFGTVDHNKKRPRVKMSSDLRAALWAAWIGQSNGDTEAQVICYHGKPISSVKKGFRKLAERCGLPVHMVTPHVLKHTYISWLCMSGEFSLDEISDLSDTTVQTIKKVYRHIGHSVGDRLDGAVGLHVADATGALGSLSNKPKLAVVSNRPTRRDLENSDMVMRNTFRPASQS